VMAPALIALRLRARALLATRWRDPSCSIGALLVAIPPAWAGDDIVCNGS
jgi:hypothetical protein